MSSVIVACRDSGTGEKLTRLLASAGISVMGTVTKGADALQLVSRAYGENVVLLCTYSLNDMNAVTLYEIKPDTADMILLLTSRQLSLWDCPGVSVLLLPVNRRELLDTLRSRIARMPEGGRRSARGSAGERNAEQQDRIARAKALLMERRFMTEPEAYRFMQKTSMETGDSLAAVAEKILNGVLS